jgi:hypothetical protein
MKVYVTYEIAGEYGWPLVSGIFTTYRKAKNSFQNHKYIKYELDKVYELICNKLKYYQFIFDNEGNLIYESKDNTDCLTVTNNLKNVIKRESGFETVRYVCSIWATTEQEAKDIATYLYNKEKARD